MMSAALAGQSRAQSSINLEQATLEDLMNMEVTSASKKEQALFRAAAAVYVLTGEDIRRSGATNLPDALRLVPGLQVATIDGNKWGVSSRGFNGLWSNKLLVLVDGRSVYTPMSSGADWNLLDVMLEDVDRIEVVRGPGASVWGANAVNGVINIISKTSSATRGGVLSAASGSLAPGIASLRYGGRAGSRGHYRIFGKHSERGAMKDDLGKTAADASQLSSGGFRFDFEQNDTDHWSVLGSVAAGERGQRILEPISSYVPAAPPLIDSVETVTTSHVLARWTRKVSADSKLSAQVFWDRSSRLEAGKGDRAETLDFEFQHQFKPRRHHDVVWGAGQRFLSDHLDPTFALFLTPASSQRRLFNVFVQDEIRLPNAVVLTVGTKVERQSGAGIEIQPTARVAWLPSGRQTVWAAVSRAARTPSRLERDIHNDFMAFPDARGTLNVLGLRGNPDLRAEHTVSYEAGYRLNPRSGVSLDGAIFYQRYSDLVTVNLDVRFVTTPAPAHLAIVNQFVSGMNGESVGGELLLRWQPLSIWTLDASVDYLRASFTDIGNAPGTTAYADREPRYQARVRSQLNLPGTWQADTTWTYVARLKGIEVPAYGRLDVRVGRTVAGLTLNVTGQNLLRAQHREFGGFEGVFTSQVPRGWVASVTWAF